MSNTSPIALRVPSTSQATSSTTPADSFTPPSMDFLARTWHVTHSTLPMWRSKRDVTITYRPIPHTDPLKLDDVVEYHSLHTHLPAAITEHCRAKSPSKVLGIDRPSESKHNDKDVVKEQGEDNGVRGVSLAQDWRGRGLLKIASSHWEILGYGELTSGERWAVTYFAKTLFTPAGVDVYCDRKEGLPSEIVEKIKQALSRVEDERVSALARELFEIVRTGINGKADAAR